MEKWLDFNKVIPELKVSVLAVDSKDGYMEVVDVQEIEGKLCICTNNGYSLFGDAKPTHWMPLPSPPRWQASHLDDGCESCENNKPGIDAGLWCINNCVNGSRYQPAKTDI